MTNVQQKLMFDSIMETQWKKKLGRGYARGIRVDGSGKNFCALGVVGDALGNVWDVEKFFPAMQENEYIVNEIAFASNTAGNVKDAIKAVKAVKW